MKADWDEVYSMIRVGIEKIIYCVVFNRASRYFFVVHS